MMHIHTMLPTMQCGYSAEVQASAIAILRRGIGVPVVPIGPFYRAGGTGRSAELVEAVVQSMKPFT